MKEFWILCLSSVIGTLGFGMIYHMRVKRLPVIALGALLACAVVLFMQELGVGIFASNLAAAFCAGVFAEICARVIKAPVIVFLTPAVIPLVPGNALYLAIRSFIESDYTAFWSHMSVTVVIAFGISAGIICSSMLGKLFIHKKSGIR